MTTDLPREPRRRRASKGQEELAPNAPLFGEIKWFGGFNFKTGRENDYGFVSWGSEEVFFHRSEAQSAPDSLLPGTKVIFQLATRGMGKSAAVAVCRLGDMPDSELVALLKGDLPLSPDAALMIALARDALFPCESEALDAISALSSAERCSRVVAEFWEKFPPSSPQDPFFEVAPDEVKRQVCRAYYSTFRSAFGTFSFPYAMSTPLSRLRRFTVI